MSTFHGVAPNEMDWYPVVVLTCSKCWVVCGRKRTSRSLQVLGREPAKAKHPTRHRGGGLGVRQRS